MTGRPFRFERDFDARPAAATAAQEGVPSPEALRREALERARAELAGGIEAARREAFEEGRRQGRAEAEDAIGAESLRLVRLLAGAAEAAQAGVERHTALLGEEAGRFVAGLMTLLLPGLERELAGLRLERFVEEALGAAPGAARVVVRVPPAELVAAEAALDRLQILPGGPAAVELREEPGLEAGAAEVVWEHGGMALDPRPVAEAILAACARLGERQRTGIIPREQEQ